MTDPDRRVMDERGKRRHECMRPDLPRHAAGLNANEPCLPKSGPMAARRAPRGPQAKMTGRAKLGPRPWGPAVPREGRPAGQASPAPPVRLPANGGAERGVGEGSATSSGIQGRSFPFCRGLGAVRARGGWRWNVTISVCYRIPCVRESAAGEAVRGAGRRHGGFRNEAAVNWCLTVSLRERMIGSVACLTGRGVRRVSSASGFERSCWRC